MLKWSLPFTGEPGCAPRKEYTALPPISISERAGPGQIHQRSKKISPAQCDEHRQTRQIGLRLHIFHHAVFEANFLRAVESLIFQVNELRRSDGDIQHVNGL